MKGDSSRSPLQGAPGASTAGHQALVYRRNSVVPSLLGRTKPPHSEEPVIATPTQRQHRYQRRHLGIVLLAAILLAAGMALEWGTPWSAPWSFAAGPPQDAGHGLALPAFSTELRSERYLLLADALRHGDLAAAEERLSTLAEPDRTSLGDLRVLLGLAAYVGDAPATARDLLADDETASLRNGTAGPFADWREMALAELAAADGDFARALGHYARLIEDHPTSPLRPRALVAAASLHQDLGADDRALELVRLVRREGASARTRIDMEVLAWEIGSSLDDDGVLREAGRRLLISAPWRAAALGAADLFLDGQGQVEWRNVLSAEELESRAATFLHLGQADAARITLGSVALADRHLEWHLLTARAFTEVGRSREALAALEVPTLNSSDERARVEYQRGLAALDLADPEGGGSELSASERTWMRTAAQGHLERAAELTGDAEIAAAALRRLYGIVDDEGLERQHAVLAALRRHDPRDRTGAQPLWEAGWTAFRSGDHTAAVDWWSELAAIYPGSREAHRGLYWQARALQKMGRRADARRILNRLVDDSDTTDFYRRQALVRLGATPWLLGEAAEEMAELIPWEIDPALRRAKLMTDLGLDPLARRETAMVEEAADPDDAAALRALILTRTGKHGAAMRLLLRAYPQLGGPTQGAIPTEILRAYYPLAYADEIRDAARRTGLPPYLVAGIIRQESGFDPRATSPVGARGLMQVMPATGREVAASLGESYEPERLYDPGYSILLGSTYFSRVLKMFDGNVELALAAYNGGPNRIRRMWRERERGSDVDEFLETLPIEESRNYVQRILVHADSYRRLYPGEKAIEATPAAG